MLFEVSFLIPFSCQIIWELAISSQIPLLLYFNYPFFDLILIFCIFAAVS